MTVEAALANYQSAKVPFVSVLEAMTSLYADRWTRVGLVGDHARLRASLAEASLDATPDMTHGAGYARGDAGRRAGCRRGRRNGRAVGSTP